MFDPGRARTPYNLLWNFDLQQTLPGNLLLDAAYSANHVVRLNLNREFNALEPRHYALGTGLQTLVPNPSYPNIPVGALTQPTVRRRQPLLPYPLYTGVGHINSSSGNSIYHSLALKVGSASRASISPTPSGSGCTTGLPRVNQFALKLIF